MTSFTPLKQTPAYVELAEAITSRIIKGQIKPNEPLPIEQELADQFNVHRSTLREGLRVLEESGLVKRVGKRLIVQKPSHTMISNVTGRAYILHEVTFGDIYELAILLTPASAELAAKNCSEELKEKLKENIRLVKESLDDPDNLTLVDIEFFNLVAEASNNKAMMISLRPLNLIFYTGFHPLLVAIPVASKRMLEAHTKIVQSICAGDAATARHWMEKHVKDFKRGFEIIGLSMDEKIGDTENIVSLFLKREH